MRDWLEVWR